MRHLGAVLAAGVVLVLAAACGGQTTAQTAPGAGPSLGTAPATTPARRTVTPAPGPAIPGVHLPPGARPVAADRVDAHALPFSFPKEVWTEHGGTVLGFQGEVGGCFTSRAVVDQQTARQVTVRLIQQEPGTGEHACPMFVRYKPMSVPLTQPLGDRSVRLLMSIIRG